MTWQTIFVRLLIIFMISGIIGYDRQYKNKPAGIKTHILVGLGSGIIALVQLEANANLIAQAISDPKLINIFKVDNGRLIAQVVSGIGFLGAGTIIVTKEHVKGLTTAASLWATATLGITVGSGYLKLGVIGSVFVFFALVIMNKFIRMGNLKQIEITYTGFNVTQKFIEDTFKQEDVKIDNCHFDFERLGEDKYTAVYTLLIPPATSVESIIYKLRECRTVLKVSAYEINN